MKIAYRNNCLIALLGLTLASLPWARASASDETSSAGQTVAKADTTATPAGTGLLAAKDSPDVNTTASSTSGANPTATPQASKATAEIPGVAFGIDERFRFEGYNNADFNSLKRDKTNQLRIRLRPFADVNFNSYFEGYVRIAWEGLERPADPSYPAAPNGKEQGSPFITGEVWFDNAYIKVKKFPWLEKLSLQAGRFDLIKGDGWLFNDPSGLDGPREGYTNAFDFVYRQGPSAFELIGVYNPKYDDFFPVWNKYPVVDPSNPTDNGTTKNYVASEVQRGRQLQEWDETAIGVYYANRQYKNTDIDAYTFFKKSYGDLRIPTYYEYLPDRHYTLFGGRVVERVPPIPGLSVTGEFADEIGTEDSMKAGVENFDIRAWGGFGYAKQRFRGKTKPYVTAGVWLLSGQSPTSRTVGNFDPLFNRSMNTSLTGDAPSWSEFYIFSEAYENGSYYWTNLKMPQVETGFTPVKQFTLIAGYAHMNAMEPYTVNPYHAVGSVHPAAPAAGIFGTGLGRAQLAKARLVYHITPGLQGYLNLEKLLPGDFYIPHSSGYWFRCEVVYKFNRFVPFPKTSD